MIDSRFKIYHLFIGQVSQVKLVLARFAKSQLDGTALINAFALANLPYTDHIKTANLLAQKIVNTLEIVLKERDGPSSTW